jgi:hypothetical protein
MTSRSSLPVVPSAPFDLVAVAVDGSQVIIAWTECENSTLGFHVERADGTGSACRFLRIGRTASHVTVYRDESVTPRKTYSFRVHAWNASGDSFSSNVVSVTTPQAGADHRAETDD